MPRATQAKTIKAKWDAVFANADKLKDRIHKLLVLTLEHYQGPGAGDLSLFAYAINGLRGSGVHRRAAIQWVTKYARAVLVINKDGTVGFTKKKGADHTTVDVDKASTSPFYADDSVDGRTEEDLKTFNVFGRIRSAIKKAREIQAAPDLKTAGYDPDKTVVGDADILDKFEELVEMYGELDKPQTKTDKKAVVFKGARRADMPKLQNVG